MTTAETHAPSSAAISSRQLLPAWVALAALAVLAWTATITQARGTGVGPGTMGLSLPLFLAMWVVMMTAMMFPSVAPVATLWARSVSSRASGAKLVGRLTLFLGGYLLAWAGYGLAAFAVLSGVDRLVASSPSEARWFGTSLFAVAGLYQLTPLKDVCLRRCRSPIGSMVHYAGFREPLRDLRVGLHHGAFCVGCCWGLMVVLVAVGVMNVAVMAVLALVIFLEKLWRRGQLLSRAVGVILLAAAALAPWHQWLMPALRTTGMRM